MNKTDVFVLVENEDWGAASAAVRSLKKCFKAPVEEWFIVGPKSERLERFGYDLGTKTVAKSGDFDNLGSIFQNHGAAPYVLIWSSNAVLIVDWQPWSGDQIKIWSSCPACILKRENLQSCQSSCIDWASCQELNSDDYVELPESQVKKLPFDEYEKAYRGTVHWPFSPHVIILDKTKR